jgi:hypothetical protein
MTDHQSTPIACELGLITFLSQLLRDLITSYAVTQPPLYHGALASFVSLA